MPYKGKEQQKEANRLASQRRRDKQKGMTEAGYDAEGMTRIEVIQKELNDDDLIKGIEAASKIFKDRDARYERAYRYHQWRKGVFADFAVPYALVYDREKLEKIHQSLKGHNVLKEVRYGVNGPTFDVVGELLEVTK